MVRFDLSVSDVRGSKPTLQVFAMDKTGTVLASSNNRQLLGSALSGSITWSGSSIEFRSELLPRDASLFPIILHAPIGRSIAQSVGLVEFSLTSDGSDNFAYKSEPVDLTQGDDLDWFVVTVGERVSEGSLRFKNICSFPHARGDVVAQLKDLVSWIQDDPDTGEWIDLKEETATKRVEGCRECGKKNTEIESLKRERDDLLIKIEKHEILIEKLRKERREGLVSDLIGPETLPVVPSIEDTGANVENLLRTQEELIGSIKQHLMKLSNQVKAGQRIRAIRIDN